MDSIRLAPQAGSRLLIVGGCGGIGRSLLDRALQCGIRVAVFDLPRSLEERPLPDDVPSFALDATSADATRSAMAGLSARWPALDALVTLAGFMGRPHPEGSFPQPEWDAIFEASFDSTLNCTRAALPLLRKSDDGAAIVTMSSGLADVCNPGYGPYSAAKAAVVALTRTLAREEAPQIRCNCVSPGGINTPFLTGGTGRDRIDRRIALDEYVARVPLGRMGEAEDVAGPILFLLSSAARYITGQVLNINGGAWMN
jgi:3-oxoacyl-[acyl-carrier protein] reductase